MTSRADDYVHGAQTYVFTYTLENVDPVLQRHRRRRVLLGRQRHRVAAGLRARRRCMLVVPPDLADSLTGAQSCYVGYQGSGETCGISEDAAADGSATVRGGSRGPCSPYQTVTIAVGFEKGTFAAFDSSLPRLAVGMAATAIAGLGRAGRARLRDRDARASPARRCRAADDHRRVHAAAAASTRSRAPCCWAGRRRRSPPRCSSRPWSAASASSRASASSSAGSSSRRS